jgi:hypothetical protein
VADVRAGRRIGLVAPSVVLAAGLSIGTPVAAQPPARDLVTAPQCSEQAAQVNGPDTTDVNAQAGNGRITVGLDSEGNITVFRYPNPSYYNQVKYFTTGPDASTGVAGGQLPNEGSFGGLLYTVAGPGAATTTMQWLKAPDLATAGWTVSQHYASDQTPVVVTTYRSPAGIGLTVTVTDLADAAPLTDPAAPAAFVRQFTVQLAPGSPVVPRSVELVYYEHFDAIGSRFRYFPVEDSCFQQVDDSQTGAYVEPSPGGGDAIVQSWSGIDAASDRPSAVAFSFGFDRPSSSHQVGEDGHDPLAPPLGAVDLSLADGYDEMTSAPHRLTDSDAAAGQVTGTLTTPLDLRTGSDAVRVIVGAGATAAQALAALQQERGSSMAAEVEAVDRYWGRWLARAPLPAVPATSPQAADAARIDAVAARSLITIRLAVDPDTGAIVASADTQGPYGEDWVRDGSFIDAALDEAGHHGLATRHAEFEASAQTSPANPDVLRPPGNWPMNVYGDGIPGGPIPYEIDETGFGAWTLYQHSTYLSGTAATAYLLQVFPAIARAANWLSTCKDPQDGLQCYASEDDNVTPTQTLHGAGPDLLGLESAVKAAQALAAAEPADPRTIAWQTEAALWAARASELQAAIEALYDADGTGDHLFAESSPSQSALAGLGEPSPVPTPTETYSDGGWLLWPVQLAMTGPQLEDEAAAVLSTAVSSLENTRPGYTGAYEAKGLLGVCRSLPELPPTTAAADRSTIEQAVAMLSASSTTAGQRGFTTDTGLFAESWRNYETAQGVRVVPLNDAPHVWEHALYYMTALCAFPPAS